jgi:hypothetical protein
MTISSATKSDEHGSGGRVTLWMWLRAGFVVGVVPGLALFLPRTMQKPGSSAISL